MKWLFSLITLFFFTLNYGQEYPPMVEEGATWIYEKFDSGPVEYFAYHIKGDTTINGVAYAILNDQGLHLDNSGLLSLKSNSVPIAYLREDVLSKKVFALIDDATQFSLCFGVSLEAFQESHLLGENENEYLLYDFSQNVGDYIESDLPVSIYDIITIEMFGYEVRKFLLDGGQPFYEKFGSGKGLFFPHHIFFIGGADVNLIQYCISNEYECEVLVDPSAINDLSIMEFSIFPNPVNNVVNIKVSNEKIQSLALFSSEGKLIYVQKGIRAYEIALDLTRLTYTGLIYIEGITSNSKFVDRILKF